MPALKDEKLRSQCFRDKEIICLIIRYDVMCASVTIKLIHCITFVTFVCLLPLRVLQMNVNMA